MRLEELNRYGRVTTVLLLLTGILFITYLGAFYLTLSLGFKIQGGSGRLEESQDRLTALELTLHKKHNNLALDRKDVLESMVDISAIRYLTPAKKSIVASEILHVRP